MQLSVKAYGNELKKTLEIETMPQYLLAFIYYFIKMQTTANQKLKGSLRFKDLLYIISLNIPIIDLKQYTHTHKCGAVTTQLTKFNSSWNI